MLKQIFKLKPEDYETLYNGELVTITKGSVTTTLLLDTTTYSLTVNSGTPLSTGEYSIEVSDKYLTPEDIEDMFDDIDEVASSSDIASLFN